MKTRQVPNADIPHSVDPTRHFCSVYAIFGQLVQNRAKYPEKGNPRWKNGLRMCEDIARIHPAQYADAWHSGLIA
jgi:hypothetical protein